MVETVCRVFGGQSLLTPYYTIMPIKSTISRAAVYLAMRGTPVVRTLPRSFSYGQATVRGHYSRYLIVYHVCIVLVFLTYIIFNSSNVLARPSPAYLYTIRPGGHCLLSPIHT